MAFSSSSCRTTKRRDWASQQHRALLVFPLCVVGRHLKVMDLEFGSQTCQDARVGPVPKKDIVHDGTSSLKYVEINGLRTSRRPYGVSGATAGFRASTGYLVTNLCTAHVASCSKMLLDTKKQGRKREHVSKSNETDLDGTQDSNSQKGSKRCNHVSTSFASPSHLFARALLSSVPAVSSTKQRQPRSEALTSREALHSLRLLFQQAIGIMIAPHVSVSRPFIRSISEML